MPTPPIGTNTIYITRTKKSPIAKYFVTCVRVMVNLIDTVSCPGGYMVIGAGVILIVLFCRQRHLLSSTEKSDQRPIKVLCGVGEIEAMQKHIAQGIQKGMEEIEKKLSLEVKEELVEMKTDFEERLTLLSRRLDKVDGHLQMDEVNDKLVFRRIEDLDGEIEAVKEVIKEDQERLHEFMDVMQVTLEGIAAGRDRATTDIQNHDGAV